MVRMAACSCTGDTGQGCREGGAAQTPSQFPLTALRQGSNPAVSCSACPAPCSLPAALSAPVAPVPVFLVAQQPLRDS